MCLLFAHFHLGPHNRFETACMNSPDSPLEPGEGLQTQGPERKAAGDQTHAGKHDAEGGRGEAQVGDRACRFDLFLFVALLQF